jgi:hypothetical protein
MISPNDCTVLVVALLLSTTPPSEYLLHNESQQVPFCNLTADAKVYDNKIVTTEALISSSGHEVHVRDTKCPSTDTDSRSASIVLSGDWNSTKLGKKLSKILRKDHTSETAFEAVFHSSTGPYGPEGTRFQFQLLRLISVKEVSRGEHRK